MAEFIISIEALQHNARILHSVAHDSGARIVLALKGFSSWHTFPAVKDLLSGCCASGLWEARLAQEFFGKHILTYSPAYTREDITELVEFTHHLDFNSISQWHRFKDVIMAHNRYIKGELCCGIRVNPQHSTGHTGIYDPCAPGSRLGMTTEDLKTEDLTGLSGIHMHTLCEQGAEDLASTVHALEEKFGGLLASEQITWLNLGGGHWITKPDYNRDLLIQTIKRLKEKYNVDIWLEPGEALAIHTGILRAQVLDVFTSQGVRHAIVDVSASAHMPDTLEMPYRADVFRIIPSPSAQEKLPAVSMPNTGYELAGEAGKKAITYRLGAPTCLAGDVIGDYSFSSELRVGDSLIFDDMAHYTTVKTTFFNGVHHPDISILHQNGTLETVRQFSYSDFKSRLG